MKSLLTFLLCLLAVSGFGAVGNAPGVPQAGITTVTAAANTLSNQVWSLANNSTLVMLAGRYTNKLVYSNTVGHAIRIISKTNVTIQGIGAELYGLGIGSHILVSNCLNVTFKDFSVIGSKAATSLGVGIVNGPAVAVDVTGGSRNIRFENVTIKNQPNMGIGCVDDTASARASHVAAFNCWFENIGATSGVPSLSSDGAAFHPVGDHWSVQGSTFTNVARGVEIYSNSGDVIGTKVLGNTFESVDWQGVTRVGTSTLLMLDGLISDNTITFNLTSSLKGSQAGIALQQCERVKVIGNTIWNAGEAGIKMTASGTVPSRGNSIIGNSVLNAPDGINFYDSGTLHQTNMAFNIIANNVLRHTTNAITMGGVHNLAEGNTISGFNTGIRFYFDAATGTNIWNMARGNTIVDGITAININTGGKTNFLWDNIFRRITTAGAITDNGTGTSTNRNHH